MKTIQRHYLLIILLMVTLGLAGCKPKDEFAIATPEIPTPTIPQTPHPLDLNAIKSFCISVEGSNTEGMDAVLSSLLQAMDYQVMDQTDGCDATIHIQMNGQPLSASYQVNNTSEYRECFTGAQYTGELQITAENALPQSTSIDQTKIPPNTIVDICPDQSAAPFKEVWSTALLSSTQKMFGDKVYVAAQKVKDLRGNYEWIWNGSYSPELVQGLISLLDNEDAWTRWSAANTISLLRPVPVETLPAVMNRLKIEQTREPDVISQLWGAIQNAGTGGKVILPQIAEILNTSADPYTRQNAAQTIGKIGKATPEATAALVKALKDSEPWVRMFAARSLGEIKAQPEDSVQALIDTLADPDQNVRQAAGESLGQITNHPEISPENATAWQNWWQTPPTPTPIVTPVPEEVLSLKAPSEFLNIWQLMNGKYVVYVHKSANITEFGNLNGMWWYVAFIGPVGQVFDAQGMGMDIAKLEGITSVQMQMITEQNPEDFNNYKNGSSDNQDFYTTYFFDRPDFAALMIPEVAKFYSFDKNPELIRVEFE